jgi:hypothetical protein
MPVTQAKFRDFRCISHMRKSESCFKNVNLTINHNTEGDPNLFVYRVRIVPYRFPRGTVLVDRTAYRTFLTVFRDFCLKARTLPRFKFYRSSVLTLIYRISANRTVPKHEPVFVIFTLKTLI